VLRVASTALLIVVVGAGVPARAQAPAVRMTPTAYDDGLACPGGCDAHVVFHASHNGTRNAFDPASPRSSAPAPCRPGLACRICFGEEEASCTVAVYRGDGPPPGRLDFTTSFFAQRCGDADLPTPLAAYCRFIAEKAGELRARVSCFASPGDPRCRAAMQAAAARQARDAPRFAACMRLGDAAFNARYRAHPDLQRSDDCGYEPRPRPGARWPRLLDGTCRPGSYVGREGADCCSSDVTAAAALWPECVDFYPKR
jgi:hypothetical protein